MTRIKRIAKLTATLVFLVGLILPLSAFYSAGIGVRNVVIAQTGTEVGGPITIDTTWTAAESPYIVTLGVLVTEGVTLTIEPGAEVRFNPDLAVQVDGQLIAQGTEANSIIFTSNQAEPATGDWGYILFTDSSVDASYDGEDNYVSGSILQYCIVEYGGGTAGNGAIRADSSSPFIDRCHIKNNAKSGISVYGGSPKISFNTIENNGCGVLLRYSNSTLSNNTIRNNLSFTSDITSVSASGSVEINGNIISDNNGAGLSFGAHMWGSAFRIGSGIWVAYGNVRILNNAITSDMDDGGITCFSGDITIINNLIKNNLHAGIEAAIYSSTLLTISENVIIKNFGGGIRGATVNTAIAGNVICSNSVSGQGGGICCVGTSLSGGTIINNSIIGNSADGGGAAIWGGGADIIDNLIIENYSSSASDSATISNTVYIGPNARLNGNDIYNNTIIELYNIGSHSSPNLDATNNYWGTCDDAEIQDKIYDWFDDSSLGIVDYAPYFCTPVGFGDNLWNFRWNGDDRFHDNEPWLRPWDGDNESQGRWVGTWTYEVPWSQTYTQDSGSVSALSWKIDDKGKLDISADRDRQWHAWTYVYVSSPMSITIPASGDCVPRCFLNYAFDSPYAFPATLNLEAGWNRIDVTGYNQNSGYTFDLNYSLASNVEVMNSFQRESPFIVEPIPPIFTNEDTPFSYDLTMHEFDLEDGDSNLVWSVSGADATLFGASIDPETDNLSVIPVANAYGSCTVTLTLTDSDELMATQDVEVTILPVNDPPVIVLPIPDQLAEQNIPIVIDLSPYESDVENSDVDLRWYAQDEEHSIVSGEYSDDDVITFTPDADYIGDDTVTLYLVDPECATASQQVSLTWVSAVGVCGDVAPYTDCDWIVNMGDVVLLLNYVGHPGEYQLCCDWCGDVAPCPASDGAINMGDVVLLLNYVGHPGEYELCCG